jgi:hypothetical protein
MSETTHIVALCCYKYRAVVLDRCEHCQLAFACPQFTTTESVVHFNAIIPPSMLLSLLPIELWPTMCPYDVPEKSPQSFSCAAGQVTESPVQRLVSALGLPILQ